MIIFCSPLFRAAYSASFFIASSHLAAEDFDLFADLLDLGGGGGIDQVRGLTIGLKHRVARTGYIGQQGGGHTADADIPGVDGLVLQLAFQFGGRFPEQAVVNVCAPLSGRR